MEVKDIHVAIVVHQGTTVVTVNGWRVPVEVKSVVWKDGIPHAEIVVQVDELQMSSVPLAIKEFLK